MREGKLRVDLQRALKVTRSSLHQYFPLVRCCLPFCEESMTPSEPRPGRRKRGIIRQALLVQRSRRGPFARLNAQLIRAQIELVRAGRAWFVAHVLALDRGC